MVRLDIKRTYYKSSTLGRAKVLDENGNNIFDFFTVEPVWKDNQQNVSCIPPGYYDCSEFFSPNFGECYAVHDVPGRELIRIHVANMASQLRGCIAPGTAVGDLDGDGVKDVLNSRVCMNILYDILPEEFRMKIE